MLLTLEGLDGSGKTTVWEALQDGTLSDGALPDDTLPDDTLPDGALPEDAVFTREPTDTWYGEAVGRSLRTDDADPLAECFLYTADHAAHLANTIEPALDADRVVVSDRYVDSRYAYQGASLADRFDDALAFVRGLHRPWTREPDATIYLDLDPGTAAERSAAANKFETAEHLAAVRERYERLIAAEPERFHRVDASQSPAAVVADVADVVAALLA